MESENTTNIVEIPEIPQVTEEPIVIPQETPKMEITSEEKDTINNKFTEIFNEKLTNYFSKFTNDIDMMEKMKYEFSDLFYELERIKAEIADQSHAQKNLSNNSSATARDSDKVLLTSSNARSSKTNDIVRSKTPTKLKSSKILESKDSHNAAAAKNETGRNYNTEKSKTPVKNLAKTKTPASSNLNNTIAEIPKTNGLGGKDKAKPSTKQANAEGKFADVSKSTVKTETGTKSTAASKASHPSNNATSRKAVAQSATTAKRDMTPTVKKTKIDNLDTSTISNLDNSMVAENKGNQTNKNKNGKVSQFSSKNVNKEKQDLNKTVIETSKNSLGGAGNKKTAPTTNTSKKPVGKDAGAKASGHGKGDKNANAAAKKEEKDKKEKEEHPEDADKSKDGKHDSTLKKENSVTNIMDIIAEKNKEVNIEEILSSEKKETKSDNENIKNKTEENPSEGINQEAKNISEEGKVNTPEEDKNAEKIEEIPSIEEKPKEKEDPKEPEIAKPIEKEANKIIEIDKAASAPASKHIPEYQNKRNKSFHQVILSQFLTPKENITVMLTNKELLNNKDLFSYLKDEYLKHLKNKISEYNAIINKYTNDAASEAIVNKQFALSKTAMNGMNFLKKEEETNLFKKEQPESIPDLLKFFLLLISEEYDNISNSKVLEEIPEKIYPKYKLDSLKSLIMYSIKSLNFSQEHFNKIIEYVNKRPYVLSSNDYLPINRMLSYVTFCSKEIFEYLSTKLPDGTYANLVRSAFAQVNKSSEVLSKLEKK